MRDLYSKNKVSQLLAPAARTTTATSTAVDTVGFDSLAIAISIGVCTNGTFAFKLTECDTASGSYTDVAAADIQGTLPTVSDDQSPDAYSKASSVILLGYVGSKEFVKVVCTVSGSPGTGIVYGVMAIQGHAHQKPVNV